jgi:hypothetical protein
MIVILNIKKNNAEKRQFRAIEENNGNNNTKYNSNCKNKLLWFEIKESL